MKKHIIKLLSVLAAFAVIMFTVGLIVHDGKEVAEYPGFKEPVAQQTNPNKEPLVLESETPVQTVKAADGVFAVEFGVSARFNPTQTFSQPQSIINADGTLSPISPSEPAPTWAKEMKKKLEEKK